MALIVRGDTLLRVATTPQRRDRFALIDDSGAQLKLPDETPGWEARSYALTLRGRDAFNTMTDRWMRFRHAFGARG